MLPVSFSTFTLTLDHQFRELVVGGRHDGYKRIAVLVGADNVASTLRQGRLLHLVSRDLLVQLRELWRLAGGGRLVEYNPAQNEQANHNQPHYGGSNVRIHCFSRDSPRPIPLLLSKTLVLG